MIWYIHIVEYYSVMRRKEILPFAMKWMDLESIVLSEISQAEKDKHYIISLMCGIKKKKILVMATGWLVGYEDGIDDI